MPEAANKSDLGQVAETHAMEQEFLWTCTLTGETKEFLWNPEVRLELLAWIFTMMFPSEDPMESKNPNDDEEPIKPGHKYVRCQYFDVYPW